MITGVSQSYTRLLAKLRLARKKTRLQDQTNRSDRPERILGVDETKRADQIEISDEALAVLKARMALSTAQVLAGGQDNKPVRPGTRVDKAV